MEEKELIIIGGGPAGYVAAIRACQLGSKATLIEEDTLGGVCLNRGCIPTRALVRAAELLELPKKAKEYGISYSEPTIDLAKIIARKDTIVKTVVAGVQLLMRENGIDVIKGAGKLLSPNELEIAMPEGKNRITAKRIIIATGAHHQKPDVPGGERTITTTEVLSMKVIPSSILIVGGGPIGITYATILSRLGTEVTVIEETKHILPDFDEEIAGLIERQLKKAKVKVQYEAILQEIGEGNQDESKVMVIVNGQEEVLTAQYVLVGDTRVPNIDGIGLDHSGVSLVDGCIKVNSRLETNITGIYAAGDVTGKPMLAHYAFEAGRIAAENALGKTSTIYGNLIPQCVYSNPEIATVGLTERQAADQGYQVKVGRFPFSANGLATVLGERTGFVKVVSETRYGQILGVHILGTQASELISEAVLAMRLEESPSIIGSTIHLHPTLSEALMEAMLDLNGDTIHFKSQNFESNNKSIIKN